MNLQLIKNAVTSKVARQVLVTQKHSPQIYFAAGVVGVVATVVLASKATLEVDSVLSEVEDDLSRIRTGRELASAKYSEHDATRDRIVAYSKAAGKFVRLYGPAVIVGAVSIGCFARGQIVLSRRNVALTAAYAALEKGFQQYRARVVEELGEDKDREFRYGYEERELLVTDAKGREQVEVVRRVAGNGASIYARFFDEACAPWEPNPELNLIYVKCQENWATDRLRARGHLFLNEVYDSLGMERTKAGAVVGWVISKDGTTANYVDFGVFDPNNERARDFVNGRERSILLDFNVDGVILDRI